MSNLSSCNLNAAPIRTIKSARARVKAKGKSNNLGMKILSAVLALQVAASDATTRPLPIAAFQIHARGRRKLLDFAARATPRSSPWPTEGRLAPAPARSTLDALTLLRGGAGALPLPVVSDKIHAVAAGGLLFVGACTAFAPVTCANSLRGRFLPREVREDSFDASLMQSIGAIVAGLATHVFLVWRDVSAADGAGALDLHRAMGCALMPRILLILWSFLRARFQESKGDYQFQGTTFLKVNFFIMSWTAFSLLTGAGNPDVSSKVFPLFALAKALVLVLKPVKMTQKFFGVDVAGEGTICFAGKAMHVREGLLTDFPSSQLLHSRVVNL